MSTLAVGTIKSISSAAPVFQNSSGTEKGRLAKAYVNFNGNFDATEFTLANGGMRTSYNVISITDRGGNGQYTVNFLSGTFTSVNYIAAGITGNYGGTTTNVHSIMPDGTRTVTAFPIRVVGGGSNANKEDINLVFFGD
jgi:hypothetical protein